MNEGTIIDCFPFIHVSRIFFFFFLKKIISLNFGGVNLSEIIFLYPR